MIHTKFQDHGTFISEEEDFKNLGYMYILMASPLTIKRFILILSERFTAPFLCLKYTVLFYDFFLHNNEKQTYHTLLH